MSASAEPLWGAHPFFAQDGLDKAFGRLLERWPEHLDGIDVDLAGEPVARAWREPDLSTPANIPEGMVWLPDPERRRPLAPFAELDDGEVAATLRTFAAARIPYRRRDDGAWPRPAVEMTLSRTGASLKIPTVVGSVVIFAEGRRKELAPDGPNWTCRTSVFVHDVDRRASASELLAAGGETAYVLARLRDDPDGDFGAMPSPVRTGGDRRFLTIELPVDAFVGRAGETR